VTPSNPGRRAVADVKGRIFDIQFFSIHDGPGIRTTVFFKGCPLHCLWCHNPESIEAEPEIGFSPAKCIACGACVRECDHGAHRLDGEIHVYDRSVCRACGRCVSVCNTGALEMAGRTMSVSEVIGEALKDRAFYETSGGGITLSGGEPLWQSEFASALLAAARDERLHTCVDTSGFVPWNVLKGFVRLVDLFLFDVKCLDDELHQELTGVSNGMILDNLGRLDAEGAAILLRVPFIPDVNVHEGFAEGLAKLYRSLKNCRGVEVLPYHELARSKYERFGKPFLGRDVKSPADEVIDAFLEELRGLDVRAERG